MYVGFKNKFVELNNYKKILRIIKVRAVLERKTTDFPFSIRRNSDCKNANLVLLYAQIETRVFRIKTGASSRGR